MKDEKSPARKRQGIAGPLRHRYRILREAFLAEHRVRNSACTFGCGVEIDWSAPHGEPAAPEVEHTIPVSVLEAQGTPERALDTSLWRPSHAGCNRVSRALPAELLGGDLGTALDDQGRPSTAAATTALDGAMTPDDYPTSSTAPADLAAALRGLGYTDEAFIRDEVARAGEINKNVSVSRYDGQPEEVQQKLARIDLITDARINTLGMPSESF